MEKKQTSDFVGFGPRLWAWVLDVLAFVFFSVPLLYAIHGRDYLKSTVAVRGPLDFLNNFVFPSLVILLFWAICSATPGKMAISAKIVDAKTGNKPTLFQFLLRFIGYALAALPLGLGLLWIVFDPRRQGWHDKLAGTVVKRVKK
jgi:uncharacterized RDD family membrane protein YckC